MSIRRGSYRSSRTCCTTGDGAVRQLLLSVSDSGIGIPAELQPHVFELFMQGARGSTEPGLGVGLALARRLIEMHGGRIEVRSDGAGHGSEFLVRMPVAAQSLPDRPETAVARRRIECRVVVIDDNRDAAAMLAMLIDTLGGDCRIAHDGENGLREVRTHRPQVVFLDVGMPGIDGYETCRRLRREFGTDMVVVALTGFGQERDRARAREAGFTAHVTKPASPSALLDLLERSVAGEGSRDGSPPSPGGAIAQRHPQR
jgi:CheY-like chemotaxis protein